MKLSQIDEVIQKKNRLEQLREFYSRICNSPIVGMTTGDEILKRKEVDVSNCVFVPAKKGSNLYSELLIAVEGMINECVTALEKLGVEVDL